MKSTRARRGFTLIEALVAISLLYARRGQGLVPQHVEGMAVSLLHFTCVACVPSRTAQHALSSSCCASSVSRVCGTALSSPHSLP